LLLVTFALALSAARVLAVWPGAPADAPERLAALAAGLLTVPAAGFLWKLAQRGRSSNVLAAAAVLGLLVVGWLDGPERPMAQTLGLRTEPLLIGLSSDQEDIIAAIEDHTSPDARILWDESTDHRPGWNWTSLLPLVTNRAYLGGLDPDAGMEHSYCQMGQGKLNGRSLFDWSDAELERYCWWYNVGWVVCRSSAAEERWGRLTMARRVAGLSEGGQPVVLFALNRPHNFVLSGSGRWESAGTNRVTLVDVAPDADGCIVLSLHQQDGLRVLPSYISRDERGAEDPTCKDPIPNIRLRVPGPVPRVTLVWEHP
jgi:hypothetical protein